MQYENIIRILMSVGAKYGFRPDVPIESEAYFRDLVANYPGTVEEFSDWIDQHASRTFRCFGARPEWLQSPEWPIIQGRPMMFVGQLDFPFGSTPVLSHHASYYIFLDYETGATRVVVQAD